MGLRLKQATAVGFLFSLALSAHAAPALRSCDSAVLPGCDALSAAPLDSKGQLGFGTTRDGGAVYNTAGYFAALDSKDPKTQAAVGATVESLMKPVGAKIARAKVIADQVRKNAIDYLKSKTPDSPERAGLIARLNSIEIDTETQPDETCGTGTLPGYPNAGFSPRTNTLYLCTAATNATEVILTQALTHEMGHVISPCMAKSKVYSVDGESLYPGQLSNCSEDFSRYDSQGDRREKPNETAMQLLDYKPKMTIASPTNPAIAALAGCKVLTENSKLNVPSVDLFNETQDCLTKKFRSSLEDSDAFKDALVENGMSNAKAHASLRAKNEDICAQDFEEAFADRFGASLLGHISQNWKESDFQMAALPLGSLACSQSSGRAVLMAKYEAASERVSTLFSDPAVAQRLRCESPKGAVSCPLKFSSPKTTAPSSNQPVQPRTGPSRSRK